MDGTWGVTANRDEVSLWDDENVLKLGCVDGYVNL